MLIFAMAMNLFFLARAKPFWLRMWFARTVLEGKLDDLRVWV